MPLCGTSKSCWKNRPLMKLTFKEIRWLISILATIFDFIISKKSEEKTSKKSKKSKKNEAENNQD